MFKTLGQYQGMGVRARIDSLKQRIEAVKRMSHASDEEKIHTIIQDYQELVIGIGKQEFVHRRLDFRDTATFQTMNEIMGAVDRDLDSIYSDLIGLEEALTSSFNLNAASIEGVRNAVTRSASLVLNSALANNIVQRGTFIVSDSFENDSNMDIEYSDAEIGFGGGTLTLARQSVENILGTDAEVDVEADRSVPEVSRAIRRLSKSPPFSMLPPYEGRLYSLPLENVVPEANRLDFINNGTALATTDQELLKNARRVVLDQNPDTYWQIERVVLTNQEDVDPGQLDDNLKYDFHVAMVIKLNDPQMINAVTLDPVQFSRRSYMEVTGMETSLDGQTWETVPGLHDYNFYNILTDEANRQLPERTVSAVMAPSKYSYRGRGLWVFPSREVRDIRIKMVQRTPIENPYEVLVLNQRQTVQTTKKSGSILGFGGRTKTKTKTKYKDIELDYIESLAVKFGDSNPRESDTAAGVRADGGFSIDLPGVGNVFSSGSKTVSKSGYQLVGIESQTKTDSVRYAIGIRDVGLLSAVYNNTSNYISRDFQVPSAIRQVQLRSAYDVPNSFGEGDWVKFYISIDGGAEWNRISPIDDPPKYIDGFRVPTTFLINSGTPEESQDDRFGYIDTGDLANNVRVKIEISKPSDVQGTPLIQTYALECLTQETFDPVKI
jgi:hypothetical protein